jgi:hypothetical protein
MAGQGGPSEEIPLLGGDVTEGVVRVGDTVRRPLGPHSLLVHGVLRHLEASGFTGAPRLLGVDERGREILTFVEGEVAGRPWPSWVAEPDRAASVAVLLRSLDDAMIPWGIPVQARTPAVPLPDLPTGPGPRRYFVGHRDVTPENVVFRDGQAVALIDFDMVRASSRVDEVGNLLLWWAPLMPPEDRQEVLRDVDAPARARLLVDAYGLGPVERRHVVNVAISSAERSWFTMRERARRDGGGWQRMWDEGVGDRIHRRQAWLADNAAALHQIITMT